MDKNALIASLISRQVKNLIATNVIAHGPQELAVESAFQKFSEQIQISHAAELGSVKDKFLILEHDFSALESLYEDLLEKSAPSPEMVSVPALTDGSDAHQEAKDGAQS